MKFLNDADLVLWNMDKATYLKDLRQAGFEVPETTFLHQTARCGSAKGLTDAVTSLDVCKAGCPVVVKPSISAPAKLTHLLRDPQTLSDQDVTFFDHLLSAKLQNSLMAQAFEPTIANGEYSLIFLAVLYTATKVVDYIEAKFGRRDGESVVAYARIDGIMGSTDEFALMEVELIELELWVEEHADPRRREAFYQCFL